MLLFWRCYQHEYESLWRIIQTAAESSSYMVLWCKVQNQQNFYRPSYVTQNNNPNDKLVRPEPEPQRKPIHLRGRGRAAAYRSRSSCRPASSAYPPPPTHRESLASTLCCQTWAPTKNSSFVLTAWRTAGREGANQRRGRSQKQMH